MSYSSRVFGALALALPLAAHAGGLEITGIAVRFADGDTLTILDAERRMHRVRLAGIDAPERGQPYSQRSRETLVACANGRALKVVGDKIDRYGRLVGKVLTQDGGEDCNLRQVRMGMAWHDQRYAVEQSEEDARAYARAEEAARGEREGLWRDPAPQPPWEHRESKREQ